MTQVYELLPRSRNTEERKLESTLLKFCEAPESGGECENGGVLSEQQLDCFQIDGFVLVPDVLSEDEIAVLQAGVWQTFPPPEQYFADPASYAHITETAFSGLVNFPWASPELNRLVAHPRILSIVRQILGIDDIRLYKGELWAKYAGNTDYDQHHHRDFGNHTLVVPSVQRRWMQVTTFIYLCDVDETNGATAAVSKRYSVRHPSRPAPYRAWPTARPRGAGLWQGRHRAGVFHGGLPSGHVTDVARRIAFTMLADYKAADASWTNKHAFGHLGQQPEMIEFVTNVDPATRTLLDIPAPGHPYWTDQTIADMEVRYPGIDMAPYHAARR